MTLRLESLVIDFNRFSGKAQVRRATLSGDSSYSCSAQLRLKVIVLINVKMPTIVGILTFISRINYRLWQSEPEIQPIFVMSVIMSSLNFMLS